MCSCQQGCSELSVSQQHQGLLPLLLALALPAHVPAPTSSAGSALGALKHACVRVGTRPTYAPPRLHA